jgi:hypothetical protein
VLKDPSSEKLLIPCRRLSGPSVQVGRKIVYERDFDTLFTRRGLRWSPCATPVDQQLVSEVQQMHRECSMGTVLIFADQAVFSTAFTITHALRSVDWKDTGDQG